jgi:hypothetical protein
VGRVSNAINASTFSELSFDFLKDISSVLGVAYPLVIKVNPRPMTLGRCRGSPASCSGYAGIEMAHMTAHRCTALPHPFH